MGMAPVLARVAPAVPDPRSHHRRGGGDDRGFGRGDEQSATEERRIRNGAVFRLLQQLRRAGGQRHHQAGARRPRRRHREPDAVHPRLDQHLPAPGPRPTRTLRRPDALPHLRSLSVRPRSGRRDQRRRLGVPPEGGRHLAGRWRRAPGGGHRREPAEPPRRIRPRRSRAGDESHRSHGVVRRPGGSADLVQRRSHRDPGIGGAVESAQSRDDLDSPHWSSACCS